MLVIKESEIELNKIITSLKEGQTVVYPTETCYGLGCDATNDTAVEKVFAIKGREAGKSVLMIAADVDMARRYAEWSETAETLAKKYWPGPLTIILPIKKDAGLASGVVASDNTVAFRVSDHPFARALVAAFGKPLVSTSANIAGGPNPYSMDEVIIAFANKEIAPSVGIDAGTLPPCPPTTIVRIEDGAVNVVRQGALAVSW